MVDTLRADHLSAYGYPRDTTPNLDTWVGQQGVRFRNASSTTSWTFPANAAIMTGMRPSSLDRGRIDQRSLRRSNVKLVHRVGQPGADELYQLGPASPYETDNLARVHPDLVLALRRDLIKAFGLYRALLPLVMRSVPAR